MTVVEESLTLTNRVGLHARPASLFVQTAAQFASQITATCGSAMANAKSILQVLQLGAGAGATVTLRTEGEDAEEALAALAALIRDNFGERE